MQDVKPVKVNIMDFDFIACKVLRLHSCVDSCCDTKVYHIIYLEGGTCQMLHNTYAKYLFVEWTETVSQFGPRTVAPSHRSLSGRPASSASDKPPSHP